jgi:hypothetical protein
VVDIFVNVEAIIVHNLSQKIAPVVVLHITYGVIDNVVTSEPLSHGPLIPAEKGLKVMST